MLLNLYRRHLYVRIWLAVVGGVFILTLCANWIVREAAENERERLSIVPRERALVRAGVIDRGRTVRNPALIELGKRVAAAIPFAGPVNVQCRMRGKTAVVFEINPRFSGGIPLTIAAGADFPAMLVQLALGNRPPARIGRFQADLWMTSYEAGVFLPGRELRLAKLDPSRLTGAA